jgi:hypothetical protein
VRRVKGTSRVHSRWWWWVVVVVVVVVVDRWTPPSIVVVLLHVQAVRFGSAVDRLAALARAPPPATHRLVQSYRESSVPSLSL